jgi:chromosome segregation ATPase
MRLQEAIVKHQMQHRLQIEDLSEIIDSN